MTLKSPFNALLYSEEVWPELIWEYITALFWLAYERRAWAEAE